MTVRGNRRQRLVRWTIVVAAALAAACGNGVDLAGLDVGSYPTAPRLVSNQPTPVEATLLEGIRMADAVADTSQFDSPLIYAWQADPVADTASLVPVLGEAGKQALDQNGWLAGYRASYADQPQRPDGSAPEAYVGLSIMLLRFPDDAAAAAAAAALETANWRDMARTVAVPVPNNPGVNARYTPGTGALFVDTPIGPFVVHILLEAPPDGIETRVGELEPVLEAERKLLKEFTPTPQSEIPALPRDPDRLLARMVTTDPDSKAPVSNTFAVYGPTGALRDQPPSVRKDKLYRKWGVDRLAVSGDQRLYRLRDHQAALDMSSEFTAQRAGREQEIEADPDVPDERCFQVENAAPNESAFVCRVVVDNFYTSVRADTASNVKQKAAAQYALLATM